MSLELLKDKIKPRVYQFFTELLKHPRARVLLNDLSLRQRRLFGALVYGTKTTAEFEWTVQFGSRRYSIPVSPDFSRSWSAARLWSYRSRQGHRRLLRHIAEAVPAGMMMDIGANDGLYTFPLAAHDFTCVCFEPQASCVDFILRTCQVNGFDRVEVVQAVVGDTHGGEIEFFEGSSTFYSSVIRGNVEHFEPSVPRLLDKVSVDGFCAARGICPILLKIDVEGWELHVLEGARETVRASHPAIFIESDRDWPNRPALWTYLSEAGYTVWSVPAGPEPLVRIKTRQECLDARPQDFFCAYDEGLIASVDSLLTA